MTFRAYTINGLKGEVDGGAKCVKILLGYWLLVYYVLTGIIMSSLAYNTKLAWPKHKQQY